MAQWHKAATIGDVAPGQSLELTVGDHVIALFNVEGTIYALDGICAHAGGPLGEGALAGRIVTCPWHGWQFDVASGQHCLNARIAQATFPVKIDGNDVLVEIP